MSRTVYYTAPSLDGFIADDQDSLAWLFVQDQDAAGPLNYEQFQARIGAGCMGSTRSSPPVLGRRTGHLGDLID